MGTKGVYTKSFERRGTSIKQFHNRLDLLRSRVGLLVGKDKLLMKMYLDNGNSFRQMAVLSGVSATSISRRIYGLMERLIDSEYIVCVRNRRKFTKMELAVTRDYFLMTMSQKKIAKKRKISVYRVRKILKKANCIINFYDQRRKSA